MNLYKIFFALMIWVVLQSCESGNNSISKSNDEKSQAKESLILADSNSILFPLLSKRVELIQTTLSQPIPVLLLPNTTQEQQIAQDLALHDKRFTSKLIDPKSKTPFRNEIFNCYVARPQELPAGSAANTVYKVEMYNYALNLTTTAMVNIVTKTVTQVNEVPQTQPEIPQHLKDLAIQIAINHPEVTSALGYKPNEQDALMANTRTALNNTKCERSLHLCVAPTFTIEDKALWVIVDLTDYKVVGIRWTNTGTENKAAPRISERKLKFDKIMACYCKEVKNLKKENWEMNYVITTSDGLRISEVKYKNQLVVNNAKIVDWHVSYSNTDGFGYSDAVGCPEFSQAAVVAVSDPKVSEIIENGQAIGFALEQYFSSEQWPMPCNYNYMQRYEFYNDGRFRVAGASLGRGCGNNGTYRPVFRIAMSGNENSFYDYSKSNWTPWSIEQWKLQNEQDNFTPEGYLYKIANNNNQGFYIEPNRGQFKDGSRGDFAYTYVTKQHTDKDEGDNDLVSIGPCCNTDYKQGPEKFIEPSPEQISNTGLVIWYVAQMKNDDTKGKEYCWADSYLDKGVYKTHVYPCMAGPMFVPISKK
jgi:hypothetical protein